MRPVLNFLAASALSLTAGTAAFADVVVVELFTSQGCSSCPPADELLGKLKKHDDVIALSLHVDYWDYLGWKDEFADPKNTQRQQGYAHASSSNMIYTPQMIVGGQTSIVGTRGMELMEAVQAHGEKRTDLGMIVTKNADAVTIELTPGAAGTAEMIVQLVRYEPSLTVDIRSGENAGRKITYHNVVTSWDVIGTWDGASEQSLQAPTKGPQHTAVIVQDGVSGPILAAARLD